MNRRSFIQWLTTSVGGLAAAFGVRSARTTASETPTPQTVGGVDALPRGTMMCEVHWQPFDGHTEGPLVIPNVQFILPVHEPISGTFNLTDDPIETGELHAYADQWTHALRSLTCESTDSDPNSQEPKA